LCSGFKFQSNIQNKTLNIPMMSDLTTAFSKYRSLVDDKLSLLKQLFLNDVASKNID